MAPDLQILHDFRLKYPRNLLIAYLNINSLRNKIIELREIISYLQFDYFVLSETKINDSFPSEQFDMSGYEIRARRGRDGVGGGIIEYVRGVICKRLKDFETTISESICSELVISKKKRFCMCIYCPPNYNSLSTFFDEITLSLNKAALKFENFIVMGDFNIDVNASGPGKDKLDEFCNLFDLTNLVKEDTRCINNHRSTIDLTLTNKPDSFQKTCSTETGVSDYHECISTFLKSDYSKLKPKAIHYRNFDVSLFLNDLEKTTLLTNSYFPNENYQHLTENFISVVGKHAALKKFIRGNQAPFVNRELRKAIYTRSRLRNKYWKNPTSENELRYKQQRNKCVSLRKKSMKLYLNKSVADGIVTNKSFWKFIKPFLKDKQ